MRGRSHRPESGRSDSAESLPPWAEEAEAGVLGCLLLPAGAAGDTPETRLLQVQERFRVAQPFYDLKHATIFTAMVRLVEAGTPMDLITLHQRLKDEGNLEGVGGLSYLAGLPDRVPSAAHLPAYVDLVWEKYVARVSARTLAKAAEKIHATGQASADLLSEVAGQVAELQKAAAPSSGDAMPPRVKRCEAFGEKFWAGFFGTEAEEPGTPLPFKHENFPFKIRRGEMTFVLGEKGAGKSTLESWMGVHLARHEHKTFVASMEMKPETTLKIMASQLIGKTKLQDCEQHHALARRALAWLNQRVVMYDFLGIADWRELLEDMRYAHQFLGCDVFFVDSVMRLGIPDDDYAQQGDAAKAFANFCLGSDVHLFLTNHLNKSDRSTKQRSRGSQQWIDNSHNVISVERNEKKAEKISEMKQKAEEERLAGEYDAAEWEKKWKELRDKFDSKFALHNQRWPGSRQNGSVYLWFDYHSLQYRDDVMEPCGVNFLDRWTRHAKGNGE